MSDVQAKKKKQMLSSYSIVFLVLIVVAILTWFVPQSVVIKNNGTKEIIYNAIMVEGKVVTGQGLQPMGLWDILMAPIRGFVKAAPVGFAILMAGSFLHLMNHVGAMNSAIGWLLKRVYGKGPDHRSHVCFCLIWRGLWTVGRNPGLFHGRRSPFCTCRV